MAFLAEVGAERDKEQQTKTRWALEYYVSKLAESSADGAPTKATGKKATGEKVTGKKTTGKKATGEKVTGKKTTASANRRTLRRKKRKPSRARS